MWMEVFYDDATEPSVSVPCLDFFGVPHGRPVPYASALTTMPEGRGLNAFFPMPFRGRVRVELTNGSSRPIDLYYQIDYTRQRELPDDVGFLHCSFRRENPTTMGRDFVIATVPHGPGRFLGCVVGVRVLDDGTWYGEGEVKVYRDGDRDLPTICGTGLEDYVGSAWGMGAHHGPYAGAPLVVGQEGLALPGVRRLLPLARRRSDRLHRRAAGDDPADRHAHVPCRRPSRSPRSPKPIRRRAAAGTEGSPASKRSGSTSGSTTTARPRSSTAARHNPSIGSTSTVRGPTSTRLPHERADPMESWFSR